jgi:anti-sigma-K factor RskA
MTHQELIESAASYALDALDGEERAHFEAHLADCAECRTEVAAYREVAGALAHTAPATVIPRSDALRERILRDARQVRPITAGARVASAPPASAAIATLPRARTPYGAWTLAAASMAAAVVIAFAYRGERERSRALGSELAEARTMLVREDSTLAALVGPEVHVVSLAAGAGQKPVMRVFWNHTRHTFVVAAQDMPPSPAGRTYQLWAIRKGKPPASMGTFAASASGRTITPLAVSSEITDGGLIDECALTVEPMGGSPQPTETPRLVGVWRHVD